MQAAQPAYYPQLSHPLSLTPLSVYLSLSQLPAACCAGQTLRDCANNHFTVYFWGIECKYWHKFRLLWLAARLSLSLSLPLSLIRCVCVAQLPIQLDYSQISFGFCHKHTLTHTHTLLPDCIVCPRTECSWISDFGFQILNLAIGKLVVPLVSASKSHFVLTNLFDKGQNVLGIAKGNFQTKIVEKCKHGRSPWKSVHLCL